MDFYPTPSWCVNLLLDYVDPINLHKFRLLEPCAGKGHIISAVNRWVTKKGYNNQLDWTAHEIDQEHIETLKKQKLAYLYEGDFMKYDLTTHALFDLAICNPPYQTAEYDSFAFIKKIVAHSKCTFAFLRAGWIGSAKRNQWLRENPPDIFSIPHRPSFYAKGTDLSSYAWFVWQHPTIRAKCEYGRMYILPTLTAQERKQCLEDDRQSILSIAPSLPAENHT